ncbi:unnamed protein product [Penicillium camemberti]|uniref:Str. FM013 n=1 Tax=Penicillium camemberti (strain FM 013) TaxID=1429867 RepID=A0A0G4PD19_PENC3|nr:unnamed protein product [Penicillium camemberti]
MLEKLEHSLPSSVQRGDAHVQSGCIPEATTPYWLSDYDTGA